MDRFNIPGSPVKIGPFDNLPSLHPGALTEPTPGGVVYLSVNVCPTCGRKVPKTGAQRQAEYRARRAKRESV